MKRVSSEPDDSVLYVADRVRTLSAEQPIAEDKLPDAYFDVNGEGCVAGEL